MQVLQRIYPETYWDFRKDIGWELRGLNRKFSRMACNIEPVWALSVDGSWARNCDDSENKKLLEELQKVWVDDAEPFQETKETILHAAAVHGCLDIVINL